jgi:hypothetical protein
VIGWRKLNRIQEPHCLGVQVAQHFGLQAVGDHGKQNVAGKVGWSFTAETHPPSRTQRFDVETAQASDLGIEEAMCSAFGCGSHDRWP